MCQKGFQELQKLTVPPLHFAVQVLLHKCCCSEEGWGLVLPGLPWLSTEMGIQKRHFAGAAPDQVGEEAPLGRRLTLSLSGLRGSAWTMNDTKHKWRDVMWEWWEAKTKYSAAGGKICFLCLAGCCTTRGHESVRVELTPLTKFRKDAVILPRISILRFQNLSTKLTSPLHKHFSSAGFPFQGVCKLCCVQRWVGKASTG